MQNYGQLKNSLLFKMKAVIYLNRNLRGKEKEEERERVFKPIFTSLDFSSLVNAFNSSMSYLTISGVDDH